MPERDGDLRGLQVRGQPRGGGRLTSGLHPDEAVLHDVDAADAMLAPVGRVGHSGPGTATDPASTPPPTTAVWAIWAVPAPGPQAGRQASPQMSSDLEDCTCGETEAQARKRSLVTG